MTRALLRLSTTCAFLVTTANLAHCQNPTVISAETASDLSDALNRPLSSVTLETLHPEEVLPADKFAELSPDQSLSEVRGLHPVNYFWTAPGLYHNPLYTEDVTLERYGWSRGPAVQPFISASKFVTDSFFMPYQMGLDAPRECKTTLGYYRPGSCAPNVRKKLPFSAKAAALQIGATVGAGALFQ